MGGGGIGRNKNDTPRLCVFHVDGTSRRGIYRNNKSLRIGVCFSGRAYISRGNRNGPGGVGAISRRRKDVSVC
jgi:hypothetical protein